MRQDEVSRRERQHDVFTNVVGKENPVKEASDESAVVSAPRGRALRPSAAIDFRLPKVPLEQPIANKRNTPRESRAQENEINPIKRISSPLHDPPIRSVRSAQGAGSRTEIERVSDLSDVSPGIQNRVTLNTRTNRALLQENARLHSQLDSLSTEVSSLKTQMAHVLSMNTGLKDAVVQEVRSSLIIDPVEKSVDLNNMMEDAISWLKEKAGRSVEELSRQTDFDLKETKSQVIDLVTRLQVVENRVQAQAANTENAENSGITKGQNLLIRDMSARISAVEGDMMKALSRLQGEERAVKRMETKIETMVSEQVFAMHRAEERIGGRLEEVSADMRSAIHRVQEEKEEGQAVGREISVQMSELRNEDMVRDGSFLVERLSTLEKAVNLEREKRLKGNHSLRDEMEEQSAHLLKNMEDVRSHLGRAIREVRDSWIESEKALRSDFEETMEQSKQDASNLEEVLRSEIKMRLKNFKELKAGTKELNMRIGETGENLSKKLGESVDLVLKKVRQAAEEQHLIVKAVEDTTERSVADLEAQIDTLSKKLGEEASTRELGDLQMSQSVDSKISGIFESVSTEMASTRLHVQTVLDTAFTEIRSEMSSLATETRDATQLLRADLLHCCDEVQTISKDTAENIACQEAVEGIVCAIENTEFDEMAAFLLHKIDKETSMLQEQDSSLKTALTAESAERMKLAGDLAHRLQLVDDQVMSTVMEIDAIGNDVTEIYAIRTLVSELVGTIEGQEHDALTAFIVSEMEKESQVRQEADKALSAMVDNAAAQQVLDVSVAQVGQTLLEERLHEISVSVTETTTQQAAAAMTLQALETDTAESFALQSLVSELVGTIEGQEHDALTAFIVSEMEKASKMGKAVEEAFNKQIENMAARHTVDIESLESQLQACTNQQANLSTQVDVSAQAAANFQTDVSEVVACSQILNHLVGVVEAQERDSLVGYVLGELEKETKMREEIMQKVESQPNSSSDLDAKTIEKFELIGEALQALQNDNKLVGDNVANLSQKLAVLSALMEGESEDRLKSLENAVTRIFDKDELLPLLDDIKASIASNRQGEAQSEQADTPVNG